MPGWKDALVGFGGGVGQGLMFNQMKGMFGDAPPAEQGGLAASQLLGLQRPKQLSPVAGVCAQFGGELQLDGRCLLPNGEEVDLFQGQGTEVRRPPVMKGNA